MSDKNKLHYYFKKSSISSHKALDTSSITAQGVNTIDTAILIETNESNNASSSILLSESSTSSSDSEYEIQDNENLKDKESASTTTTATATTILTTPTITTNDLSTKSSSSSTTSSFKRDPARGPEHAREFILLGPYQSVTSFPTVNHRHFCLNWYNVYKWIEYSETTQKACCFVCRFAYSPGQCDDAFTKNGFNNWAMAMNKFKKHEASIFHKKANESFVNAVKNNKDNMNVLKLINIEHKKATSENRNYLKEIIRTIIFIAKQGLSFRGHRENDESDNKGNLLELLEFRSLENELIRKKLGTVKYTHHSIQNEMLSIIQQHILSKIVSEIKISKYHSIMIDESTDISRHQQVSLVIRYTDDLFSVYERFIGFERASDKTGEGLFNLVIEWLNKLDLDIKNIIGQCFDGASSMRGSCKGVANLDVAEVVVPVRNNFGIVKSLYNLIEGSPKRHKIFDDLEKEAGIVPTTLKQLCDTRGACRYESLKAISSRYSEILSTLTLIDTGDSFILLLVIKTFDFVFHIYMVNEIFLITNILSKFLQYVSVTLTDVLAKVNITIDSLQSLRNENEFTRIWDYTMKICDDNDIDAPV
ncbi:unnamed protein product [Rotaria magnacalcarata]|uniref:TTF-type domain-containing protein n=1 Tax=Rotaria magnacalcarata TaxID=392030 RepID=A0A816BPX3_9BILA|nr:unnamed protein product [Rotaria magnacalcarata]CAF1613559.1 unnamed protein product [Rotaria magnacalcarata]CAF4275524.1 unnamed protein product [Rotaria magnacalcarata]CAF4509831.1 unnamed protein product [Rotaria magnacalcarata]